MDMEEPPVQMEGPPGANVLQLEIPSSLKNGDYQWVSEDKFSPSNNNKVLFLTVEYISDGSVRTIDLEQFSPSVDTERVSSLDPNLSSSGRYSPLYNALVLPDGQSQFHNSFVMLPTPRARLLVNNSEDGTRHQVVISEESISNEEQSQSQSTDSGVLFYAATNGKTTVNESLLDSSDALVPHLDDNFTSNTTSDNVLLTGSESDNKIIIDSNEFGIGTVCLKDESLLYETTDQSSDLLMKAEDLMEVNSFKLEDDVTDRFNMEEQSLSDKVVGEYLLPNPLAFTEENLEVLCSSDDILLCDKSRLRRHKKHLAGHLGIEYWCEDCDDSFDMKCPSHELKTISDKPVLSRARATLPKEHLAINKLAGNSAAEGVFARKTIPKRVQFGPVEGLLQADTNREKTDPDGDDVKLLLEVETGAFLKIDVTDEDTSNWMRFVRRAKTVKEQNLILTQQGKSIYFTSTRLIPPRQELKVGYSAQYAEKRELQVLEDKSWQCFECPDKFSSSFDLQKHLHVHDEEYNSETVSKRRKSNDEKDVNWKNTNSVNNGKDKEKVHKCTICNKVFPRNYSLKRHLYFVHADRNSKEKPAEAAPVQTFLQIPLYGKKPFSGCDNEWLCTHCNLLFDNPSVLNLHTLTHAAEDLEAGTMSGLPSDLTSVYHEGEFLVENGHIQCPQCTQEFSSKRELIDHVSTHAKKNSTPPPKANKCDQCYKSFVSEIRLQRHMLVHGSEESKPYQCETCFKRFLNNSALACHVKTHCDKKCFECPLCKEEFEQVFGLKEHVKIHSNNGLFTCPHCNKIFDGYSVVRKHIRAFHSDHQHACKDCGKMCPTLDKLRMHSLRHSDHREFLCANCGKQFKRKDKLKEHMKRMHSIEREMKLSNILKTPHRDSRKLTAKMTPGLYDRYIYKCRPCMVGFKRRGMLVNHLANRHPDIVPETVPELNLPILKTTRDYYCQYCDKIYKSSSKRKAHILKNHPGAELPLSNRQKGGVPYVPGLPNPTFSQAVGSVKTTPHSCQWCHKQYASKAKLLQHQRKKHLALLPSCQQTPRPARNPNSPDGGGEMTFKTEPIEHLEVKKPDHAPLSQVNDGSDSNELENVPTMNDILIDSSFLKKSLKVLPENISSELLQQAMSEFSQEHFLKLIDEREGDGDVIPRYPPPR